MHYCGFCSADYYRNVLLKRNAKEIFAEFVVEMVIAVLALAMLASVCQQIGSALEESRFGPRIIQVFISLGIKEIKLSGRFFSFS